MSNKLFLENLKVIGRKKRSGQGLLETVVALFVLVTGTASLLTLVTAASVSRSTNEYETVAANLAREGIEVAMSIRNNNWNYSLPFDNGMYVTTDYTFGIAFDPATSAWSLVNNPTGGAPNAITDALAKVWQYSSGANAGLLAQGTVATPQPATTVATPYMRLVTFDPICLLIADGVTERIVTSGSTCLGTENKVGVRVTSAVRWTERGRTHNLSAVQTIYDWR
jgi:hypothetical protein